MENIELILRDSQGVLTRLNDMEDANSMKEIIDNQRIFKGILLDMHKQITILAEGLKSSWSEFTEFHNMTDKERILQLDRELAMARKKVRELSSDKSALEQEVALLREEIGRLKGKIIKED